MNEETINSTSREALIQQSAKTLFGLIFDGTFNESDTLGYLKTLIKDFSEEGEFHKNNLEGLLFKVEELLELQRIFFNSKRGLTDCKAKEGILRKLINTLKLRYNIERFKTKTSQNGLFNG